MHSAVLRSYIVRLSVCLPSVTFRYRDHIGWNSSKIISRPNSLRPLLWLTQRWSSGATGTPPKLGRNRGGVTRECKKPTISTKRCNIGPRLLLWTNMKSHTDRRMDGRTTCDRNTALCTMVHRAVKKTRIFPASTVSVSPCHHPRIETH